MSGNDRSTFAKIFIAMMLFSLFVWMWTVALIFAWPWDKKPEWKADVRLPAVCANGEMCSIGYSELAEAFAQKKITSLLPKETTGEIADPDAYLRATRGLIGWTVLDRLAEIRCPVLCLASDRDYTPLSQKRAYLSLLSDAKLVVISDSGHAAPMDQPAQVIAAMTSFLRAQS